MNPIAIFNLIDKSSHIEVLNLAKYKWTSKQCKSIIDYYHNHYKWIVSVDKDLTEQYNRIAEKIAIMEKMFNH